MQAPRSLIHKSLTSALLISAILAAHAEAKFESDLTPEATQELMADLGGDLPFPPQVLLSNLNAVFPGDKLSVNVIPFGRSLDRRHTDIDHPRVVMASGDAERPTGTRQIYIGYAPKAKQLEIIRWNTRRREFDYLLVHDYGKGLTPKIHAAPRTTCLSCHQGASPIYPPIPWSETQDNTQLRQAMLDNKKLDPFARFVLTDTTFLKNRRFDTRTPGTPTDAVSGLRYDLTVRDGTNLLEAQQICSSICGENLHCRQLLLENTLLMNIGSENAMSDGFVPQNQKEELKRLLQQGFEKLEKKPIPDALSMRDPMNPRDVNHPDHDPLRARLGNNADLERIRVQRQSLYQSNPRAFAENFARNHGPRCFGLTKTDYEALDRLGNDSLREIKNTVREKGPELVKTWPLNRKQVMSLFLPQIEAKTNFRAHDVGCDVPDEVAPLSTKSADEIELLRVQVEGLMKPGTDKAKAKIAGHFVQYCATCHGGKKPIAPPLALENPEKLRTYKGAMGRTVKGMIRDKLMPLPGTPQPTDEEREAMIQFLEGK